MIPTIGPYLLPLVTRRLRKQLPRLKLMLYEYQTQPLLEKLRAGDIDVGILALPVPLDGLEARELYNEDFTVAVPNNIALAKKPNVKLDDLSGETLLLLEDGHCLRDQALDVCSRVDVKENEDYRATSLETLRQMVAAGLGITLLPELATRGPFGSGHGLTVKTFAKPVPRRTIGAVWRKSSARGEAINAVADAIPSTFPYPSPSPPPPTLTPPPPLPPHPSPPLSTNGLEQGVPHLLRRPARRPDRRLLRSGAHAALLIAYFGETEYRELAHLARLAATRRNPRGRPVFVLPGIMGSRLGTVQRKISDLLWLHPTAIAEGRLLELALPGPRSMRAGRDAAGLSEAAAALEIAGFRPASTLSTGEPISTGWRGRSRAVERTGAPKVFVVAHSMGGIVARLARLYDRSVA